MTRLWLALKYGPPACLAVVVAAVAWLIHESERHAGEHAGWGEE